MVEGEVVELVGILADLCLDIVQPAFLIGVEFVAHQPAFEARSKFVGLFLRRFEKNKITGIVHRHPSAGGGVNVVVLIDSDERAWIGARARRSVDDIAAFAITVFAFMRGDYADEIEQGKDWLARRLARAPTHFV